jgi:hypothetical protein
MDGGALGHFAPIGNSPHGFFLLILVRYCALAASNLSVSTKYIHICRTGCNVGYIYMEKGATAGGYFELNVPFANVKFGPRE